MEQNHFILLIDSPQHKTFTDKIGNLFGRKIDYGNDMPVDKHLRAVSMRNLRTRLFDSQTSEIYPQFDGGFFGFRKIFGTNNRSDS